MLMPTANGAGGYIYSTTPTGGTYYLICISGNSHICRGKFSTNLSPSRRIQQVKNTTSCHNSGTMNLNSIRISTARGNARYKYPPCNTMPKSPVQIQTRSESPRATLFLPLRRLGTAWKRRRFIRLTGHQFLKSPTTGSANFWMARVLIMCVVSANMGCAHTWKRNSFVTWLSSLAHGMSKSMLTPHLWEWSSWILGI